MGTVTFASLLFLALVAGVHGGYTPPHMVHFYTKDCPAARGIVASTVKAALEKHVGSAAALLNLFYHDCFVRGCDGSILLDSTDYYPAEKDSGVPDSPKRVAYKIIDKIKAAVEKECPGTVSCADIVVLAARDAIAEIGGPKWRVRSGRKDGLISSANESLATMPPPTADYALLRTKFAAKNLTELDMVVLSGAHTIGKVHCSVIEDRLYNSSSYCGFDPTLDPTYAMELRAKCPPGSENLVYLDPTGGPVNITSASRRRLLAKKSGGNTVDSNYHKRVDTNKGTMTSDQTLTSTATGKKLVKREAGKAATNSKVAAAPNTKAGPNEPFFTDFAASMVKLGNLKDEDPSAPAGEIRANCHFRNARTAPPPVAY